MKVIVHTPPPRENTYDLLGLTEDEMALLDALTGKLNSIGDAPSLNLWYKIRESRNQNGHVRERFQIKDANGSQIPALSVWKAEP